MRILKKMLGQVKNAIGNTKLNNTEENIGGDYQRPILKVKQDNPRPKPTTGCARS